MVSWILPKPERWGNFQYIKLPQRLFFGRIQEAIIWFQDLLTFSGYLVTILKALFATTFLGCAFLDKLISVQSSDITSAQTLDNAQ